MVVLRCEIDCESVEPAADAGIHDVAADLDSQPADQVYAVTKAMITGYDAYKDSAPGAGGLAPDRQTKNWVVPVHPGAVKALKEAGAWSDDQKKPVMVQAIA